MNAPRTPFNRRNVERMPLGSAEPATLGGYEVRMLDLSLEGAGIEHDMPFSTGRAAMLDVNLAGRRLRIAANIVRCRLARREQGRLIYQSALEFSETDTAGRANVRAVMTELVQAEIESMRSIRTLATA